ncbi:g9541 [Coccomyxa elongata]
MEAPAFCVPSDDVYCSGCSWSGGTCYDGECEGLHEDPDVRREQQTWQRPEKGKLIIAAGPERSGSTWLFNAIRLLYQDAKEPLDPFWITSVTEEALVQRGAGQEGHPHVLVKTHRWSNGWDHAVADHIFLTHRDLRGVLSSYQRVGWAYDIPDSYVAEHMQWRDIAHHDFAFEDIIDDAEQQLKILAKALSVSHKVDIKSVAERVDALKAPAGGPPDPVTKLWPRHMSQAVQQKQEGMASSKIGAVGDSDLKERFPAYFDMYGYN